MFFTKSLGKFLIKGLATVMISRNDTSYNSQVYKAVIRGTESKDLMAPLPKVGEAVSVFGFLHAYICIAHGRGQAAAWG